MDWATTRLLRLPAARGLRWRRLRTTVCSSWTCTRCTRCSVICFTTATKVDKKLFNELWLLQKRVPLVLLHGRATFLIPEFMGKYTAIEAKVGPAPPIGKAILSTRMQLLLQEMDDRWNERVEEMYGAVSVWCVRMESALKITSAHPVHTVLTTRGKLLVTGVLLARKLRELLVTNLYLHLKLNVSFRAKTYAALPSPASCSRRCSSAT